MNKAQMRVLCFAALWSSAGICTVLDPKMVPGTYHMEEDTLEVTEFVPKYDLTVTPVDHLDTSMTRNTILATLGFYTDNPEVQILALRLADSGKQNATKEGTEATITDDENENNQIMVLLEADRSKPVKDEDGNGWLLADAALDEIDGYIRLASDSVKPGKYSVYVIAGAWQE